MLKRLHIQNYAIIDEVEIQFSSQLNIITGETGAGKSILMGALSLILGDRAESAALLSKDKKCIVEGFFETEGKAGIRRFLKENDLGFLGFALEAWRLQDYRTKNPQDPSLTDLTRWHAYETENPKTFRGMYQFWIQKKPG